MTKRVTWAIALSLAVLLLAACGGLSDSVKHYNEGVKLQEQGDLQKAIAEYDEAIRLDPLFAVAHNNRGNAYRKLGQDQRAIEDYDEAIRLDPELTMAYYNRGNRHSDLGLFQLAVEDYNEAIRLDPKFAVAYAIRAVALTFLGHDVAAQVDIARATEFGIDQRLLDDALMQMETKR